MIQQYELWNIKENYGVENNLEQGTTLYRYINEIIFEEVVLTLRIER